MPISGPSMGITRGMKLYGVSRQAAYGDIADNKPDGAKPSFYDMVGNWMYNAWLAEKGKS